MPGLNSVQAVRRERTAQRLYEGPRQRRGAGPDGIHERQIVADRPLERPGHDAAAEMEPVSITGMLADQTALEAPGDPKSLSFCVTVFSF